MKVWGLTGGMGMGKTTAARLLGELGACVVDTDDIARQLTQPGEPALGEIQSTFGLGIISAEGRLRRDELARLVFADAPARQKLEQILHPRIRAVWLGQVERWRREGETLAVVVIPLLFETHAELNFDKILCAACLPASQQERLAARGWLPAHSAQRMASQWPVGEKMARADYVIWTEGSLQSAAWQLKCMVARPG
jgi:dephospho-CoA kinase